jgi:gliding motility-associated-like protein
MKAIRIKSVAKALLLLVTIFISTTEAKAQCSVDIGPDVTINCGDCVDLSAMGAGNVPVLTTDFDNGQAGAGWVSAGGTAFAQPCGPGPTATPYYWASTAGAGTPGLATVGFDVSCGATVSFDMAYSAQGGAAPCEGPDQPDEGVSFEYSLDGGITWIIIQYWDPNGGNDPALTAWNTYNIVIPPAAWGVNTMFQWTQANSSGACCDNWGLDNVNIVPGLCGNGWLYDWSNIPGNDDPTQQTVCPLATSSYSITLTDGIDICYDTIEVIVTPLIADATTTSAALLCPDCAVLDAFFTNSNAGSIVDSFDPAPDMAMWDNIQSGTAGLGCTGNTGNALHFDGGGADRSATTVPINTTVCGMVNFCLFMGNGASGGAPCENADAGEDVVFEYSINAGATWTIVTTYDEGLWDANNSWQCFVVPIPPAAQTINTMFRWRQISFSSCSGCDNWALDDVDISCTPPTFDYVWTPGVSLDDSTIQMPQACPTSPTTYTVTVTDPATSCSATADVYINVNCTCTITQYTANVSQCENGNEFTVSGGFAYVENPMTGTLEVVVTNGSGSYTQVFNPPFVNDQLYNYALTGIVADGSPITVDFYFTDDLTCSAQLIDVSPVLPTLTNLMGGAIYCPGDLVTEISVDVTGNGPFSVDFTLDGIPQNITGPGPTINLGTAPGDYVMTAVNDSGCTNAAAGMQTITLQATPTVLSMTGGDSYCANEIINPIMLDLSGTGPWVINYTIDGVLNTVNTATSPVSLGNIAGNYQLQDIADANCFDAVNNADVISIDAAPTVLLPASFINCENDAITLTATGAATYLWDNSVTNGVAFVPLTTTTYTVTGTDANGCQDVNQITVTVEPLPVVSFVADVVSGCEPLTVLFTNSSTGTNGVDCQWSFGDGSSGSSCDTITHIYMDNGLYSPTLVSTSINGCVGEVTYIDLVYVENTPLPSFIPSPYSVLSLDTDVSFDNTSAGAVNYVWDFDDETALVTEVNPTHEFPKDVSQGYSVTLYAYSPLGCVDSTTIVIQVKQEEIYYIPNSFTPDGDAFNQTFKPIITDGVDPYDYNLTIFNRWGETLFESNNLEVGWAGLYNGKLVQSGTYNWRIEFKTTNSDERIMLTGHVSLLK